MALSIYIDNKYNCHMPGSSICFPLFIMAKDVGPPGNDFFFFPWNF